MSAYKDFMRAELVAELDRNAAVYSRAAKALRLTSELAPHDEGEPLRELAGIYEHINTMFANWRNKWIREGESNG